ncbi:hypothetical protein EU91_1236 [Prochlorococcus marinus str. GP2]|uniref:Uncharacterized protein n=1 Tax=Prochlorococcus marinus str. GP2 TaxID=59925 RepID=A0A0A1ZE74_PROMR|nr:hypothetical protein EU91_1236 [Prochlorococcus marinus str. GP2]
MIDLTFTFKKTNLPIYIDNCHFAQIGNYMMAENIYENFRSDI